MQKIKIVNHKSLIRRSGFAITSKILQGFKIRGKKYQRNQRNLSALICEKKKQAIQIYFSMSLLRSLIL